ncbi:MAG: RNA polymerase sigma factor [Pseudomonadales bacterium]|nr:RNA polymerase sigma factor [Pseudomonadales bacterium]
MDSASIHSLQDRQSDRQLALKADRQLARAAARGDRQAFQQIVDANKQKMFTVARSVIGEASLAEDIVQEAFIKAYRALPDFRGDCLLSTWLYRISYLAAIDVQRQQKRHLQLARASDPDAEVVDSNPGRRSDGELQNSQLGQEIQRALNCLSPFEKTVFTLRHMQNFKLREIALVVNRSEGTVKNILFRAIRKLRERLDSSYLIREIETC